MKDEIRKVILKTTGVLRPAIIESSLARIWQHNKNRAFVILTSWRGKDFSDEDNAAQLKKLKAQIRGDGYGFIPVDGMGQETHGGSVVAMAEPSLLVPSMTEGPDDGSLLKVAIKWAKAPGGNQDFAQDYVLYVNPEENGEAKAAAIHVPSGANEFNMKKFSPATIGEFYTKLRDGRTFKYKGIEFIGLKFSDPPKGWIHGMCLEGGGQIEFHLCETVEQWIEKFQPAH